MPSSQHLHEMKFVVVKEKRQNDVRVLFEIYGLFNSIVEAEGWIQSRPQPQYYYGTPLTYITEMKGNS